MAGTHSSRFSPSSRKRTTIARASHWSFLAVTDFEQALERSEGGEFLEMRSFSAGLPGGFRRTRKTRGFLGWELEQYLGEMAKLPHDKFWQGIVQYYKEYKPFDICNLVLSCDILSCDACQSVETN